MADGGVEDVAPLVGLVERYYAEERYPLRDVEVRATPGRLIAESGRGQVWILDGQDRAEGYGILTLGFSPAIVGRRSMVSCPPPFT